MGCKRERGKIERERERAVSVLAKGKGDFASEQSCACMRVCMCSCTNPSWIWEATQGSAGRGKSEATLMHQSLGSLRCFSWLVAPCHFHQPTRSYKMYGSQSPPLLWPKVVSIVAAAATAAAFIYYLLYFTLLQCAVHYCTDNKKKIFAHAVSQSVCCVLHIVWCEKYVE